VAKIACDTSNIAYTAHAQEMMEARNITTTHIVNTLRRGIVSEDPHVSIAGDWKMNFRYVSAGMVIVVTVAIDWPSQLVIVTAF